MRTKKPHPFVTIIDSTIEEFIRLFTFFGNNEEYKEICLQIEKNWSNHIEK